MGEAQEEEEQNTRTEKTYKYTTTECGGRGGGNSLFPLVAQSASVWFRSQRLAWVVPTCPAALSHTEFAAITLDLYRCL